MAHEANGSRILVVDDEQAHAQVMSDALSRQGHRCELAYGVDEAMAKLKRGGFDVVVTDLMMDGRTAGLEVLAAARAQVPPPSVVLVTAHADIATCKRAMAEGAYDYIEKPLDLDSFRTQVNRAAERSVLLRDSQVLRERVEDSAGFEGIVGKSAAMQEVVRAARQVAGSDIPVLVMGESGTGKELIARAIHQNSQRRKNLLVALNCAGLSESILEDELFGHVRGAYTGAAGEREGRFEHADGGTLFMDEIGDMPAAMQAKLLRVLENGEVVRLGSNDPIRVNVRLISATNRNLDQMVAEKKFREDLFFRIKGVTIDIPPLRERRDDIPLLIHYFMSQAAERYGKMIDGIDPEARQALLGFSWPGNVRQLKNVMENMVVMTNSKTLQAQGLPTEIRPKADHSVSGMNNLVGISIIQAEKELIRNTLKMVEGNREEAAKILGIGERTLYRKIREYDLQDEDLMDIPYRVGHGYDIHRLQPGGRLMIGGVAVAHDTSAIAHSDGDVAIHALVDAILGSMGWGDIGQSFPNSDAKWKGAASRVFLEAVCERLNDAGWSVANADVTIMAEKPRLGPFREAMVEAMSRLAAGMVNVKFGTKEQCDAVGRGEAVAAHAVVLVAKLPESAQ